MPPERGLLELPLGGNETVDLSPEIKQSLGQRGGRALKPKDASPSPSNGVLLKWRCEARKRGPAVERPLPPGGPQ